MNNFTTILKEQLTTNRKEYKRLKGLLELVKQLPPELLYHDFQEGIRPAVYSWSGALELDINIDLLEIRTQETVDDFKDYLGKTFGFSFEKVRHTGNSSFMYKGKYGQLQDGTDVIIELYGCPKPPGCKLIEKIVTKEVKEYEAICEDTNEPV